MNTVLAIETTGRFDERSRLIMDEVPKITSRRVRIVIYVEPEENTRAADIRRLQALMDEIGYDAMAKGLTPEILQEILADER